MASAVVSLVLWSVLRAITRDEILTKIAAVVFSVLPVIGLSKQAAVHEETFMNRTEMSPSACHMED